MDKFNQASPYNTWIKISINSSCDLPIKQQLVHLVVMKRGMTTAWVVFKRVYEPWRKDSTSERNIFPTYFTDMFSIVIRLLLFREIPAARC